MLLGQFCFSVNDAWVKLLVAQQPQSDSIFWVLFLRGLMVCAFALGWLLVRKEGRVRHFWPPNLLHGRGLIEVALTSSFFAAVLLLPLSDVYTIMLSAPLMITAAGAVFLKESVDRRTWTAVGSGFVGVLVVVWPDDLGFQLTYAFPLLATTLLVFRELVTKRMPTGYSGIEVVLMTSLLVTLAAGIMAVGRGVPSLQGPLWPLLGSASMVTVGYLMSVLTVRWAPLSVTSTGRYSIVVFGALNAYLILGEVPSSNTIAGSLVIIASGVFVLRRQGRV